MGKKYHHRKKKPVEKKVVKIIVVDDIDITQEANTEVTVKNSAFTKINIENDIDQTATVNIG